MYVFLAVNVSCRVLIHRADAVGLRKRRHFWRADVERVALELKRHREAIEQKKPGAAEALESYKQAQAARTHAIMEVRPVQVRSHRVH